MTRTTTTAAVLLGELGKAVCGCVGTRVDGVSTVVSLRITVPCDGSWHKCQLSAGVIERWGKDQVTAL